MIHSGDLPKYTSRVSWSNEGDQFSGTAFFVARGMLLTCAHVLLGSDGYVEWQVRIEWEGHVAVAEVQAPLDAEEFPDLALLKIDLVDHPEFANHPLPLISEESRASDTAYMYGY